MSSSVRHDKDFSFDLFSFRPKYSANKNVWLVGHLTDTQQSEKKKNQKAGSVHPVQVLKRKYILADNG